MENKFKVGDEFVGVSFVETDTCYYASDMSNYLGIKGEVIEIDDWGDLLVRFPDGKTWTYPNNTCGQKSNIHTDIQSLKDKYPQFNITFSVEDKG